MKTANWIWILSGIICLVLLFGYISKCANKKAVNNIELSSDKAREKFLVDSMKIVQFNAQIALKDSLVTFYKNRAQEAAKQAKTHINSSKKQGIITDAAKENFKKDSTLKNCKEIVDSQDIDLSEKDSTIEDLSVEAESYSRGLFECKKINTLKDTIIVTQAHQIKTINSDYLLYKKETTKIIKRKTFWSGVKDVGIGIVTVALVVKML